MPEVPVQWRAYYIAIVTRGPTHRRCNCVVRLSNTLRTGTFANLLQSFFFVKVTLNDEHILTYTHDADFSFRTVARDGALSARVVPLLLLLLFGSVWFRLVLEIFMTARQVSHTSIYSTCIYWTRQVLSVWMVRVVAIMSIFLLLSALEAHSTRSYF